MACCVIVAMLIAQILLVWKVWRRRLLFCVCAVFSSGALAYQVDQHWGHLTHFAAAALAPAAEPAWNDADLASEIVWCSDSTGNMKFLIINKGPFSWLVIGVPALSRLYRHDV